MVNLPETSAGPATGCGCNADWVPSFLHHHFLPVGALAWQGLQRCGRGLVCCWVELPRGRPIHWDTEPIDHRLGYLPQDQVATTLDQLQVDTGHQAPLQRALVSYDPSTELVALMLAATEPAIVQLRQMRITPAECFQQWQRRSAEFCEVGR